MARPVHSAAAAGRFFASPLLVPPLRTPGLRFPPAQGAFTIMSMRFTTAGVVREAESGKGVPGLFVKAYDRDLMFDDLLGSAITGPDGTFQVVSEADDFREFWERRPDLYLRVLCADRETQVWSSRQAVRWNAGRYEEFDVRIPREALAACAGKAAAAWMADGQDPRAPLQPGDALVLQARGLRPAALHTVTLRDDGGEIVTQTLLSDAAGEIRDAVVWPQLGLDDPRGNTREPVEEVRRRWYGRTIGVTLADGERVVSDGRVTLEETRRPLAVATDAGGLLLNGFEVGEHDARLTLLDFGGADALRIWMVPRQHLWREGDLVRPVRLASGRDAWVDVRAEGAVQRVVVAPAGELAPGAYDFVIRRVRYGYEDDEDLALRAGDVVTSRRATGLVVRERFMPSKVIHGGCANLQQMAGRRTLGGWPYIQYSDTFQVGEDVWGALDPLALDPGHTGKMVAMYVVPHKTAAQWTMDSSLAHLAALGGNANVQQWLTQSYCVNANLRLLWPAASQPGEYDVVADFGNDTADPGAFVRDDQFDMPQDIIDGYVVPGFRVVPDPTVDTQFAHAGAFAYDEGTQGYVDVVDDYGDPWHVPLMASVHFPADVAGATTPGQISGAQPSYPLVVLVHGNGPWGGYLGYEYLLGHLARNGFIAASIHMDPGMTGTDRARVLHRHLQILFSMFGAAAANNVGIMGHSRGGEAVVIAARLNHQEAWGYNLNAVISLAPVNQYTFEQFGGAWAKPYLVMYGSLDGDVAGVPNTGFELYDRASGMKKSMMFIYRACHDRFNTVWGDGDFYFGKMTAADQARVLSADAHEKIARGYMTAFFRQHLRGETQWEGLFRGEWVPSACQAADANLKIYPQYEDTTVRTVDHFEGVHTPTSWQTGTLGGAVSETGLPAAPQENDLRTIDVQSPHQTAGLVLRWDTPTDVLHFDIPAGQRDVHAFAAVSFRVTQRAGSASNPADQPQDLRLTLMDGGGKSRAIRVSKLTEIPYPDVRGIGVYTKSAMRTVRVPLGAYTIKCLGVDSVDLTDVVSLTLEFAEKPTGEVEIDSVQFTD